VSALIFPLAYFDVDTTTAQTSILTLGYFLSAVLVGITSLGALLHLVNKNQSRSIRAKKSKIRNWSSISSKLQWPALANFLCLCISSVSPAFASKITSLVPVQEASTLLKPEAFIPLTIVLWNIGDLLGSILAVSSRFLIPRPRVLYMLSLARVGFIPLYLMCNIDGRGSVAGDWFYLIIVQFSFSLTHSWLSGASIMGVPAWVEEEGREEAGAFMGMTLVTGLVVGSMIGLAAAQA
jgi:equilibrative nucleoside transporter 1/2/3